jgi:hypothetical protein
MSDDRIVKKVFLGKSDGRMKQGRQKLSRLDCTENDIKSIGGQGTEEETRRLLHGLSF